MVILAFIAYHEETNDKYYTFTKCIEDLSKYDNDIIAAYYHLYDMGLPANMGVGWIDMDPYGDFYRATVYPVLQVRSHFKPSEPKTVEYYIELFKNESMKNYWKCRIKLCK